MHLRPATAADLPLLNDIAWAAKASWGYPLTWLEGFRSELTIELRHLDEWTVVVAEMGQQAAAFYAINPTEPEWTLEHLWVHPRAQRSGLGRALVEDAQRKTVAAGRSGLTVDADPHAEAFYLHLGACRVGLITAPMPGDPARVRPQLWLPGRPNIGASAGGAS